MAYLAVDQRTRTLEVSRQFAKIFVMEANQHKMHSDDRPVRILRASVTATLLYTSIESNSSCYTMSGNEKRSCAKVRCFQLLAQFLPQTTRALQAQPDCDEKWFNTRTENRNFLHEDGMHCQSTPGIESIIQDEFDVVKR